MKAKDKLEGKAARGTSNQFSIGKTRQEVAFEVLSATYVLTFNDEAKDKLEDEAAAEFIKNKTAFGIGKTRPRTKRISLFECLLQTCRSWQM
jgi:hypothetical protein